MTAPGFEPNLLLLFCLHFIGVNIQTLARRRELRSIVLSFVYYWRQKIKHWSLAQFIAATGNIIFT
jgi:hypothetical protein